MAYKDLNKKRAADTRWHAANAARQETPRYRFYGLRTQARVRKIVCELSLEGYLKIIVLEKCFYCGGTLPKLGSGLDRKNSSLGYTTENCVPCCTDCNMIRGKDRISHSEMIEVAALLNRLRNTT